MNNPNILDLIKRYAIEIPEVIAAINPRSIPKKLTYKELYTKAYILSEYISENVKDNNPIVVYGHKNPYMLVCFLASVMSGHAYCPVDISMPDERIGMILDQTQSGIMFSIEPYSTNLTTVVDLDTVKEICNKSDDIAEVPNLPINRISGNQTYYIIFTSGSTGTPKGVEITSDDLDNFLIWSSTLGAEAKYGKGTVFLNQAPFSFDLSVMDLYTSLYCGSTLCMMDKSIQKELSAITPFIKENGINAIVATPSFVNMCLLDHGFSAENIPTLESFFFCGETLANRTAKKLIKRFPNAVIQNTYGPTESTVAVCDVRITADIIKEFDPLPVGKAKDGTAFIISDYEKRVEGNRVIGEILITGDTLAKGYFKREDLTSKAFIQYDKGGELIRAYRTGDLGYLDGGQLFYCGRIDLQIKLNGYRIEIGDIESNILKQSIVENCAVIPRMSDCKVKALVAVIVKANKDDKNENIQELLKNELGKVLPSYMVPQNYEFIETIPMTNNGKVDRKKLAEIIEEN